MFKVGDRVKVVNPRDNYMYYSAGAEGVLTLVDGDIVKIKFDSGKYDTDSEGAWWADASGLEIVPEPVQVPTSRSNDPATSKGERRVNKYEQVVFAALVMHRGWYKVGPPAIRVEGMTGKELALFTNLPLNSITPRFAPLRRKGLIKDSGERRDKQIVWVLA